MLPKLIFESLLSIVGKDVLAGHQKSLNLRVTLGDKLDDERVADPAKKTGNPFEWEVVGNRQVMDQGQRQCRICRPTFQQRCPFLILPANAWAGVCQVKQEWEDMANGNEREIMMGAAIMYQIPISMVFLSKVLPYKSNRMANMVAAGLMTAAVIGGGNPEPHYIVCAATEVVMMAAIGWKAYKWTDSPGIQNVSLSLNPQQNYYWLRLAISL